MCNITFLKGSTKVILVEIMYDLHLISQFVSSHHLSPNLMSYGSLWDKYSYIAYMIT